MHRALRRPLPGDDWCCDGLCTSAVQIPRHKVR